MKSNAAVLYKVKSPLQFAELQVPELRPGQVLAKILFTALCHSQLNEILGLKGEDKFLPHTLGHEASAIVEKIGKGVTKVKAGDYVVLSWIKGRGLDGGSTAYEAETGVVNSGPVSTFLQYAVVSENRVTKIDADVRPDVAALLGCTVPTAAGIIKNAIKPVGGESLAIFGAGGIGLAALLFAQGCSFRRIIVVDISDAKLEIARKFGATHMVNALKEDPVRRIAEIGQVDYAIESSGSRQAMEQAFEAINDRGLVVIAGNLKEGERISIDPFGLIKGKRIIGTWGGETLPDGDIPFYANLYRKGTFPIDRLVTRTYQFSEINAAIAEFQAGNSVRILLKVN